MLLRSWCFNTRFGFTRFLWAKLFFVGAEMASLLDMTKENQQRSYSCYDCILCTVLNERVHVASYVGESPVM